MFYSPSRNACYASEFRADYEAHGTWPEDAREISDELHASVVTNRPADKIMQPGLDGLPMLADRAGPTKETQWEAIKAKRDAVKSGGVKVGTKWYHTDTESRIQHLGLLEKAKAVRTAGGGDTTRLQALGNDIQWKTMDGTFIYLTVKHAEDIFAAVTDLDAASFAAAETHRAAMEASADPSTYDFSAGWPATFAG